MVSMEDFITACDHKFSFLAQDFGMSRISERSEDWGFEARYQSEKVGVVITFELRDFYIFVKLSKLIDGEIPGHPGEVVPDMVLYSFDLDDIVTLRDRESLIPEYGRGTQFNLEFFEDIAAKQGSNLKNFASDVLGGDFSVFSELDKIVKSRARDAAFRKWGEKASEFGWI